MEWKISNNPVDYTASLDSMENRIRQIRAGEEQELVWLLEHPALYTAGSSARTCDMLDNKGLPVYETGRGGQYTYHGPGQRVVYSMLDLKKRAPDIRCYVQNLEACIINALAVFGVKGEIKAGRVGVWVQKGNAEAKIAAIGVRVKQWVTYHGAAININPDLYYYNGIIPCGIRDFGVTSLHDLGVNIPMQEFDAAFKTAFDALFCP